MKRIGLSLAVLAVLVAALIGGTYAYSNTQSKEQTPQAVPVKESENKVDAREIIKVTNDYRVSKGLVPLAESLELNASSLAKANDMEARNYWGHYDPDGNSPFHFFVEAEYYYQGAGENLAFAFHDSEGVVDGWINSPEHNKNLIGDYSEVGVSVIKARNFQNYSDTTLIVAHYGRR